jgi:hypothetical protein
MPVSNRATARRHGAMLASLIVGAAALAVSCVCTIAPMPDARAETGSTATRQIGALPPIASAALADALAKEEQAKQRGWRRVAYRPISFPLPLCLFEGGLCGADNRDGSIAVAPRYDFVDDFHEGRAMVRSGGLYGYVDAGGKVVVEPQYAIAGRYRLGLAEVDIGGRSALIDLEGRQVLAPRFASAIPFTKNVFWVSDGAREQHKLKPGREEFSGPAFRPTGSVLRTNAKWGLVDASGAWIREPEFRDIAGFDPENNNLMWAQATTGWGLIRPNGTWALEPTFQYKHELSDGLAAVWRDGKLGYIDRAGQIAIPVRFDTSVGSSEFAAGLPAPAKLGKLTGLIDRSGNWVIEPAYDRIYPVYSDGPAPDLEFKGFWARRADKTDILDYSGKAIISGMRLWPGKSVSSTPPGGGISVRITPGQYPMFCSDGRIVGFVKQRPWLFDRDGSPLDLGEGELWWPLTCEAPYVVKIGGRYSYIDKQLRPLTSETFDAVGLFRHGLAAVQRDGKYGLVRTDGTWAIEPSFDLAQPLAAGVAWVKSGGRAGLINATTGAWITSTPFDNACLADHGLLGVVRDGKAGVIDQTGAIIIEPKYDAVGFGSGYISSMGTGLVPVQSEGKWGFVDAAGNEVIPTRFDAITRFERGMSWVQSDGEWCAIDRRDNRIPGSSCQKATPTNIVYPSAFSCRISPLHMPDVPHHNQSTPEGLDRPLIRPKRLD